MSRGVIGQMFIAIEALNELRADLSSSLARLIVNWYIFIGNPVIATGLMSFLLHEVSLQAV